MSMHRGAEILLNIAAAGYGSSTVNLIASPNISAPPGTPLQKVQAAAGADPLSNAYTLAICAAGGNSDTFTCAQTNGGRFIVADSAGDVISWPG